MPSPLAPHAPPQAVSLAASSPRADASPMELIRALASPCVPACDPAGSTSAVLGSAALDPGAGPGSAAACVPAGANAAPTAGADSEGHPAEQGACGSTAGVDDDAEEAPVPEAAGAAPGEGRNLSSMSPGAASASDSALATATDSAAGKVASGEGAAPAAAGEARAQSGPGQAETGPCARAERRVRLVSPVRPPQAPAEAKAPSPGLGCCWGAGTQRASGRWQRTVKRPSAESARIVGRVRADVVASWSGTGRCRRSVRWGAAITQLCVLEPTLVASHVRCEALHACIICT